MTRPALTDFAGHWILTREIEDHRAGDQIVAQGRVVFSFEPDGLTYDEDLIINLPGRAPMKATRRYFWKATSEGAIHVHFEDGRFFHQISLEDTAPTDHHFCDPDDYKVRYDFSGWPHWSAIWNVKGPRKDYVMISHYRPQGSP